MSFLIARVSALALFAACVQGLDILGGASQHRHKHKHHKHHHKQHKAAAAVNSTASALPAAISLPPVSQPSQPSTATVTQQEPQHAVPSQSLAIFDSEAQQALPAIVEDVRKAAAHKAPLDELKKTHDSETKLLEDQEALLKADQTGLDKSVLQQQVESTKAMLQNLESQIASKRQDAVNILGKALSDARTAMSQASSEETAQQAAARLALEQVQAAQKQKVNAKKVIDEAQKVMDIFGGSSAPSVTAAPAAPALPPIPQISHTASEPQELS
ncbi:unnamed protein product [Symbiodinium sp. CCMP2456]|nr:unnamed protein product [Symbiodinium sp. CCMP2456]